MTKDKEKAKKITDAITANDGYCPCKLEHIADNICPCKDLRTNSNCICGLFETT